MHCHVCLPLLGEHVVERVDNTRPIDAPVEREVNKVDEGVSGENLRQLR